MIPRAYITAWRTNAPWPTDAQVEQDLILCRALVSMLGQPAVAETLAMRGGTALHKLFISPPGRYSEDIDLVQVEAGPIEPVLNAIRASLDPWLGEPRWKRGRSRVSLVYRFETTVRPVQRMRLKIEINTREHFSALGFEMRRFQVKSPWFDEHTEIKSFGLEEILGTKLRALYQRKKGRDLFDLWAGVRFGDADIAKVVDCFQQYMARGNMTVSRAEFESNLAQKMDDSAFLEDILPLLPAGTAYRAPEAEKFVKNEIISRLPGEPWKGNSG